MGHGHRSDSLDRFDRHLSDSFVDTDWRRTKTGRAIFTVVDLTPSTSIAFSDPGAARSHRHLSSIE
jgi:hypothetical protein